MLGLEIRSWHCFVFSCHQAARLLYVHCTWLVSNWNRQRIESCTACQVICPYKCVLVMCTFVCTRKLKSRSQCDVSWIISCNTINNLHCAYVTRHIFILSWPWGLLVHWLDVPVWAILSFAFVCIDFLLALVLYRSPVVYNVLYFMLKPLETGRAIYRATA